MLTYLQGAGLEQIYQKVGFSTNNAKTITTLGTLHEALRRSRERGFSVHDE